MADSTPSVFSVKGKTALVTGASSGLGAQFAIVLAKAGADVILAARREDKLQAIVQSINEAKKATPSAGTASALTLDVNSSEANVSAAIDEAWTRAGKIDIVVNNAGILRLGPALEQSSEDWDAQFGANVKGLWLVMKLVGKKMADAGTGGSIVNISSCYGSPGSCTPGVATYTATKAAVQQLTRNFALELGKFKIRVNTISPGLFPSEMSAPIIEMVKPWFEKENPVNRVGNTEADLEGPLLLLASDAGAYITGADIRVDGGMSLLAKNFGS